MFLSLFFTFYVLGFSEKRLILHSLFLFENEVLEKLNVIPVHTFIASV